MHKDRYRISLVFALAITSVTAQSLDCERALITEAKSRWEFHFSVKLEEQATKHKLRIKLCLPWFLQQENVHT